jgi:hypothetical protein
VINVKLRIRESNERFNEKSDWRTNPNRLNDVEDVFVNDIFVDRRGNKVKVVRVNDRDFTIVNLDTDVVSKIRKDYLIKNFELFDDMDECFSAKTTYTEKISDKDYSQSKKGIAYKVFQFKNGKLYPPMVPNAGGQSTPTGVWLDAEPGEFVEIDGLQKVLQYGQDKEKMKQRIANLDNLSPEERAKEVKKLKNSTLAYRPGWHLGDEPRASQFDRQATWEIIDELPEGAKSSGNASNVTTFAKKATEAHIGEYYYIKDIDKYAHVYADNGEVYFPYNFIWAECEYVMDIDYQEEAHDAGVGERKVTYKLLPDVVETDDGSEYEAIQFKQGSNIFTVTFNNSNDIRIDGYPFDNLERDFNQKDSVQKEVQNYFLRDNMDIIKKIINSGSKRGTESMKIFTHISGDLKHLPTGGYYKYRTNPRPDTVPWVITGAIKVTKLLDDYDVQQILGSNAPERQGGNKTLDELGLKQI